MPIGLDRWATAAGGAFWPPLTSIGVFDLPSPSPRSFGAPIPLQLSCRPATRLWLALDSQGGLFLLISLDVLGAWMLISLDDSRCQFWGDVMPARRRWRLSQGCRDGPGGHRYEGLNLKCI